MDSKPGDGKEISCSFDWRDTRPSVAIVETIECYDHANPGAESRGLQTPLQHALETDALDSLLRSAPAIELSVTIEAYQVTIQENTVTVARA